MEEQTNIEEVDLSKYRFDGNWDWYREMSEKYGEEPALKMCTYLEAMANRLKVGQYIDIPKLVTNPEKLGLAVKIACVVVISTTYIKKGPVFEMNKTYTRLIRRS